MCNNQVFWFNCEMNVWYLLKTLVNFVILMNDYQIYHSDLKRENIVITYNNMNKLTIKIIDLGGVSFQFE